MGAGPAGGAPARRVSGGGGGLSLPPALPPGVRWRRHWRGCCGRQRSWCRSSLWGRVSLPGGTSGRCLRACDAPSLSAQEGPGEERGGALRRGSHAGGGGGEPIPTSGTGGAAGWAARPCGRAEGGSPCGSSVERSRLWRRRQEEEPLPPRRSFPIPTRPAFPAGGGIREQLRLKAAGLALGVFVGTPPPPLPGEEPSSPAACLGLPTRLLWGAGCHWGRGLCPSGKQAGATGLAEPREGRPRVALRRWGPPKQPGREASVQLGPSSRDKGRRGPVGEAEGLPPPKAAAPEGPRSSVGLPLLGSPRASGPWPAG